MVVGLHDTLQVVVEHRQHRRTRGGAEPEQAALGERPDLGVVVGAGGVEAVLDHPPRGAGVRAGQCPAVLEPLPRRVGERWLPAVGRIDEDRRSPLAVDPERVVAAIDPERVVAADVPGRSRRSVAAHRRRLAVRIARLVAAGVALELLPRDLRRFLLRQERLVAEALGPLQRRQRRDVVGARQIGPSAGVRGTSSDWASAGAAAKTAIAHAITAGVRSGLRMRASIDSSFPVAGDTVSASARACRFRGIATAADPRGRPAPESARRPGFPGTSSSPRDRRTRRPGRGWTARCTRRSTARSTPSGRRR